MNKLIIMCPGHTLPSDLNALPGFDTAHDVMAVNVAACWYPGVVHYWASVHPETFFDTTRSHGLFHPQIRAERGHNMGFKTIAPRTQFELSGLVDIPFTPSCLGGTSAMYAVKAGIHLGYEHITLAGITLEPGPYCIDLDGTQHVGMSKAFPDHNYNPRIRKIWLREHAAGRLQNVRAVSGWVSELLGTP